MMGTAARIANAETIKRIVQAPAEGGFTRCSVFGCHRPTQRSDRSGLSETYCQNHMGHIRRHGHPFRPSYRAWELKPYRKAVQKWMKLHGDGPLVRAAIGGLDGLLASQPRSKPADYQRWMKPKDKARNTLARLYEAGKTGSQLFAIVLTIKAAHSELGPFGAPDWECVQIAKQAKKLRGASGTIRRNSEGIRMADLHPDAEARWKRDWEKWPRGEGIFMRHLGRMIEQRAGVAIDGETIGDVSALIKRTV